MQCYISCSRIDNNVKEIFKKHFLIITIHAPGNLFALPVLAILIHKSNFTVPPALPKSPRIGHRMENTLVLGRPLYNLRVLFVQIGD